MQKKAVFKTKGMQRDLSASAFNSEYAYENKNIRITATDDNTLLSIVNEKGNKEIVFCKYDNDSIIEDSNLKIQGTPIGRANINEYLVLFTHDNILGDFIYYIKIVGDKFILQELYNGNLSFSTLHPIETLASYENNEVIKVYWVDGENQPRVINIVAPEEVRNNWNNKSFDFIQELQLNETLEVEKQHTSGSFSSGVIQYAFNYYNKNGQETNIVEVSPINYVSYEDRGVSAEEVISNSFKVTINNPDTNFDYLRLYSIHRTSLDATPLVKVVTDLKINKGTLEYIDTGITGEIIDPVELLYKGGEYIIPSTLAQKDGTLFLGNIKIKKSVNSISESLLKTWREQELTEEGLPMFAWQNNRKVVSTVEELTGYYPYKAYLNNGDSTSFKSKETYRLGIQFQDKSGKWSEPVKYNDLAPSVAPKMVGTNYYGVTAGLRLSKDINDWALSNGYVKVRPVIVFPQEGEREIVAQGILCPTVFNAKERQEGSCFSQSSWFLRPNVNRAITFNVSKDIDDDYLSNNRTNTDHYIPEKGSWAEFRHYRSLPPSSERNAEIQISEVGYLKKGNDVWNNSFGYFSNLNSNVTSSEYISECAKFFPDSYYVDQSILTFHSPEIELEKVTNISGVKARIVGNIIFNANAGDIDIQLENSPKDVNSVFFDASFFKGIQFQNTYNSARSLISGYFYFDTDEQTGDYTGHLVYPWQSKSTLNSSLAYTDRNKYGVLKQKKLSNLKYSLETEYFDYSVSLNSNNHLFSGENLLIPPPKNIHFLDNIDIIKYNGIVDTIVSPYIPSSDYEFYRINNTDDFDLYSKYSIGREKYLILDALDVGYNRRDLFNANGVSYKGLDGIYTKDPVSIKYKSTNHAVIVLDYISTESLPKQVALPSYNNIKDLDNRVRYGYGNHSFSGISYVDIPKKEYSNAYLYLAELYREVPNKFGGDNTSSNLWYPAGKSEKLILGRETIIEFTQGDTFFARFDSLKTYPYTLQDTNSIVEIGSFMVETRINLDARYDRNRGKKSNLVMTPTNFNLFNEVYNQRDTFFNYRIKDEKYGDITYFPNLITYTKTKTAGELVDTWTNITLASTLDLDGDRGEVTALRRLNNNIIAFQNTGISQILYNENVQIASTEGVPIEIANSGKVTGKRYISDKIGCTNKWSICETPSGLYFVDDVTKGIYLFNGQLNNISDKLGFNSWINKHSNLSVWNPEKFSNFITYYDKVNGDVLFVNKDECLAFSEALGQFTSFYSYEEMYFFTNLQGKGISFKDKNGSGKYFAWLHNEGDYNKYFGEYKPFYTTLIVNPNMTSDKIFNNIEFRSDSWGWVKEEEEYKWKLLNTTFDTLEVWNEYQSGEATLIDRNNKPSNLKRKFRIWRANIPRDKSNGRDRMRNPWLYLKLSMNNENTNETILHDIIVDYFE